MIKLRDIFNEIQVQKKEPLGAGWEQVVYPYLKNPNYVIKKWHNKGMTEGSIDRFIYMYKQYPNKLAKSFKLKDNHDYYIQEKIDNRKFKQDIIDEFNIFIKKVYNYYKNFPTEQLNTIAEQYDKWGDWTLTHLFYEMIENNVKYEDLKFSGDIDDFGSGHYSQPMQAIIQKSKVIDLSKFITNKKLYNQLKEIVPLGNDITITGEFHEGNLGYDKDGNLKIIDI